MRFALLFSLALFACGGGDRPEPAEDTAAATSTPERWCKSYHSEDLCPKSVCVWFEGVDGGEPYCGLPADR